MLHHRTYFKSILAITVILLMASPTSSAPVDAYGGYISDDRVNQGDTVDFSGTFYNTLESDLFVVSFNVSFIERLGETATREPDRPNISKYYETTRRTVISNSSLTDTITEEVDFDPGSYDVSIFFVFSETQQIPTASALNSSYALINATFIVDGATEALRLAEFFFYALVVVVVGVIGLLVYNSKFRKSY